MINDAKLLDDFWALVEHLLNTVLFVLGGTVWGAIIAEGEKDHSWTGRDWGFLILLYVLLAAIRMFLFACTFPITSRIGLKTSWPETFFQVHGGLRGAVGIALAIFLDNEVREASGGEVNEFTEQTRKVFGLVGGIAFMTLTINGVTAGPLLRKLHLADSSETREMIVKAYKTRYKAAGTGTSECTAMWKVDSSQTTLNLCFSLCVQKDELVRLLTQPRFKNVNFALVKHHVPYMKDLSRAQLMEAVEKHKDTTRPEDYQRPYLKRILPYLPKGQDEPVERLSSLAAAAWDDDDKIEFDPELHARKIRRVLRTTNRMKRRSLVSMRVMMGGGVDPLSVQELRSLFISVLRAAYDMQMRQGELEYREYLAIALDSSLDFAADDIDKGEPLRDWDYVHLFDSSVSAMGRTKQWVIRCVESIWAGKDHKYVVYNVQRLTIERSLAFMAAHRWAQSFIQKEFEDANCELSESGKVIISESQVQYRKAEAFLEEFAPEEVAFVVSHKFCLILLNSGVSYM
jgi:Sodium/hydrogen exchanger family